MGKAKLLADHIVNRNKFRLIQSIVRQAKVPNCHQRASLTYSELRVSIRFLGGAV